MQTVPLAFLIRQAHDAVRFRLEEVLRPQGLSSQQARVLAAIRHHPGISSAQLARSCFVSAQAMGELLRDLQGEGLLKRTPDAENARVLRTVLTRKGKATLRVAAREVTRIEALLLAELGASDAAAARRILERCVTALREPESLPTDRTRPQRDEG